MTTDMSLELDAGRWSVVGGRWMDRLPALYTGTVGRTASLFLAQPLSQDLDRVA
jgi:hypothetical protein